MLDIKNYKNVQRIAKTVLSRLRKSITHESTEASISNKAVELMREFGVTDTWYYNTPALVLLGSRSCLSISGKEYKTASEKVGQLNLVTVDLSPKIGNYWGDCSRSFVIEDGVCVNEPANKEFEYGIKVQKKLHEKMKGFVSPKTKFSELYEFSNDLILKLDCENLDFLSNLGHSIETDLYKRHFIDKECHITLGDVDFFTFEPHIRRTGSSWGFKHENIYYFSEIGRLKEL